MGEQRFAPLGLLDLVRAGQQRFQVAVFVMSWAAVLMPMPGTPGTLSVGSPASAWISTTLSGVTPNFSNTSASRIGFCLMGSSMITRALMSCIRSLSEDTMVTRPPVAAKARA
jgi:hypothetical protein